MSQKARVCVISPEIVGPHKNGGVGTHSFYLSAFLSQQLGQHVTVAYTGWIEHQTEAYWKDWFRQNLNVEFIWITPPDNLDAVPDGLKSAYVQTARRVYEWLRQRSFDVCHFQEVVGNGFRCFQAKRLGLAFQNTILTCMVHSSWEWICQAMQAWPHKGSEEMQAKFMERYCTEHCDVLISPSQYMLDWVAANHLQAPPQKHVLPYLFDPQLKPVGHRPAREHVIFFGRLEVRKGLLLFLETLLELDRQKAFAGRKLRVTFLGKSGFAPNGGGLENIKAYEARLSPAIQVEALTGLGQPEALNYLKEHNDALVVCPSLIDNSPFAIIESLQLGLNIIAGKSGGIPELFAGEDRLFEPAPGPLAAKLQAGLNNELAPPKKSYDLERSRKLWGDFCKATLPQKSAPTGGTIENRVPAKVRVFVPADGAGEPEAQVIAALKAQTCSNYSLNPVPDSGPFSSDPAAPALILAPGCVPHPNLIERLMVALQTSDAEAIASCAQIPESSDGPAFVYEPLGPCLEGGPFANFFGLGCLLLRRAPSDAEVIRNLLGPAGIWTYLVHLSLAAAPWAVCPEILVRIDRKTANFSFADTPFPTHLKVIDAYGEKLPLWARCLLLNAVGTERNLLATEQKLARKEAEIDSINNLAPGKILFKVKRETSRVVKQARALVKGKD